MASSILEIIAFTISVSGWVLVTSTLPTDYWKVSTIDGVVITTATFWANLWKTCVTDSTGISDCKDFPSMLALDGQHPLALSHPCLSVASPPGASSRDSQGDPCAGGRTGICPSKGRLRSADGCPVRHLLSQGPW